MADSEATFKFRCPQCDGKIGVGEDFISHGIHCPHCEVLIRVPEPGEAYATLYEAPEIAAAPKVEDQYTTQYLTESQVLDTQAIMARTGLGGGQRLSEVELDQLAGGDAELRAKLAELTLDHSWELRVASEVLDCHMQPLRASVFLAHEQRLVRYRRRDHRYWVNLLDEYGRHYHDTLISATYNLGAVAQHTLFSESPMELDELFRAVRGDLDELLAFHEGVVYTEMADEERLKAAHQCLAGWAPYSWRNLHDWCRRLRNTASQDRKLSRRLWPQLTLTPPTYTKFFALRDEILAG